MVNYLDSMAWDIVISAALIGIAAIKLRYKAASDSVEEENKSTRIGFSIAIGAAGLYLFLTGMGIIFIGPFDSSHNLLFGGVSGLGGLALLGTSLALYLNGGLKVVSYFAAIAGIYSLVDVYALLAKRSLTRTPEIAALGYLGFAVAALLSVPATHSDNKWLRYLFAVFAFLFALVWLFEAAEFTLGHLGLA